MKQETARDTTEAGSDNRVSRLSFAEIPGQSRLFVEYQNDPISLREFYPNAVRDAEELAAYVPQMLGRYTTDRVRLCDALSSINAAIGATPETFANIEKLRRSDTVAVVTGQQAGLFSGPLYTIYKALSAVRMSAELEKRGVSAVPVFWGATEDHDFAEVAEAFFRDAANGVLRVQYDPSEKLNGVAVGTAVLDDSIGSLIGMAFDGMPLSEFSSAARQKAANAWTVGKNFGEAFGRTLATVLGRFGIIYLDPLNAAIKRLAAPIYAAAVERSDEIVERLVERREELAGRGFHTQVLVEQDYFPLFWHDESGVRRSLRRTSKGDYQAKDSLVRLTREELISLAAEAPEKLSPGVMLRAAVQDFLLPTACYFGGGAEVAYFAQNSVVYEELNCPVTPILHRQSFTVVEPRQRRTMEKFGLDLTVLFVGEEAVRLGLAAGSEAGESAAVFAEAAAVVDVQLRRLGELSTKIDSTLTKNAERRRTRIDYHIEALRKKALLAEMRRNEVTDRQISELFSSLLPNGHLQERVLNVFDLLARYGDGVIDTIYDSVDIDERGHRVIYL